MVPGNRGDPLKIPFPDYLGKSIPLGLPLGASDHAVISHFPTLSDIHGYGLRDPFVCDRLQTAYPRFREHPKVRALRNFWTETLFPDDPPKVLWSSPPNRATFESFWKLHSKSPLPQWMDAPEGGYFSSKNLKEEDLQLLWDYTQHFGGGLSSRRAESLLLNDVPLHSREIESLETDLVQALNVSLPELRGGSITLKGSGMAAISQSLIHFDKIGKARGRSVWAQIGWLYTDTIWLLDFLSDGEAVRFPRVPSMNALLEALGQVSGHLCGVFVEFPTNPLMETVDLEIMAAWCRERDIPLVVDPTLQSIWNFKNWDCADCIVSSLTKYAGHTGDLLAGVSIVPDESPWREQLAHSRSMTLHSLGWEEMSLLKSNLPLTPQFVHRVSETAKMVIDGLQSADWIDTVFSASENNGGGGVFSFTLRGSLEPFFNALKMAKGPSFGTLFSNICPYMHLAHFRQATSPEGRKRLESLGVAPDLLRLSVGTEDPESILDCLNEAAKTLI